MAEETKQSEPSVAVTADAKETPEAAVTEEENDDASDAPKKQAQNVAEGRNDNAADDSSSASGTAKEIPETVVEEDLYDDDDEDSAGQDRGDVDELEDTPSVGKGGGSGDDMDDGEEEDEEEEEEEEEGGIAPVLGEEERLVSIPGPRLRRQASAVGEFDYNVIGNRASDRFKHCVRRIESDPWDTDAWQVLVAEAQHGRGGGMGYREVLREFLKQFPASGRYRRMLAQAEMESGDWQTADKVMQEGLEICASLELWLFYLERARRSGTGAGSKDHASKADIIAAFELALQHVGMNPTSTPIWQEYLAFIKSWEERNPLDKGDKMTSLRKVYQRAVRLPLEGLERMWRECEDFEVSGNEHLWKNKFSVEYLPKYMAAKAVFRERKQIWEGINPSFLAKPPRERDEEQARQYRLWKRRLSYEKGNPEATLPGKWSQELLDSLSKFPLVDEDGLRARVRHSYGQCLSHLWHFAEIWYDLAEYEFSIGEGDRASRVYQQAVTVVPGSDILRIAQADLEERRGKADEAHKIWRAFLDERHSTVGHIMYLRFVRRNIGKEATRRAFGQTRALRRSGALDYRLYLAHASIELHVNGEPEVARRVLEHGLSKHESYISEPKYVLAYIDFLVQRNEQDNLKVLFERVLEPSAMSAGKARPIWERYVELELCLSRSGGSLTKSEAVEARMHQVYNDEPGMTGLAALWRRCSIAGCGDRPDGEVDTAFKDRVVEAAMGRDQHGKGGRAWRDWARDRDDRPWDGERHHTRGGDSNRSSGANGVEDRRDGGPRGDFRDRSGMPGRGRQEGGGKSAGSGKAGGGDGFSGPGTGGGRSGGTDLDDDEGWTRVGSSVSPLIPPFLRKLFMTLPRHTGPQPDADGLIQALRERALPFKPSTGDDARRGKRRRADSDDEDGPGVAGMEPAPHKKPVRDIFRQRMQANLTPFDD